MTARCCAEQTLAIPLQNAMKPGDFARVVDRLRHMRRD